ncbi:hypothetical protein FOVG_12909 [Fusarium oxysporum f. sp. pisi HDV247]|uniref:2EXR domain-containing protein n=1 Tax=Fusarium oxysporum f. sp. pisi HDV247 TaxID=1080344 RepID=W9P719_FUSOX|nr:hypothetical protein FOVG_12909 [Fusarium oxysporum f. sp. pisi HDV247]
MEERTFHLFSQLPLELREHIWKMAMPPDKPGVQTFRAHHPELDNQNIRKTFWALHPRMAPPGIVMTDFIILQLDDMITFNWDFLNDLFRNQRGLIIGIEYSQKWAIELYEHDEDEGDNYSLAFYKLFELAEEHVSLDLWLIDHNLKRRKGAPSQKDSVQNAFASPHLTTPVYASDRKFLKVNLEQGEDQYMMGTIKSRLSILQINFNNEFTIPPSETMVRPIIFHATLVYLGGTSFEYTGHALTRILVHSGVV